MDIKHATGGGESSLFAGDLVEMYKNYCGLMGFRFKQVKLQGNADLGGRGC
jgi:protein subunit release factor A